MLTSYPTALQFVALGHDTLPSEFTPNSLGLGLVTIDHVVPFQCSTNVLAVDNVS
jgi:hypothetical protein